MIAIAAACAFTAAVTAQQPCSFGYGCASMNFTVGHIKGNKWLEGGVGFEEYLMIPYVTGTHSTPLYSRSILNCIFIHDCRRL